MAYTTESSWKRVHILKSTISVFMYFLHDYFRIFNHIIPILLLCTKVQWKTGTMAGFIL